MNYERLAGAPKYSEGRAAARSRRHKVVVERKRLEKAARAEDREKRRSALAAAVVEEIERKAQEERARIARYEKEREEKRQRRIMRENRIRMERDRRVKRLLIAAIQSQGKRPRIPAFQSEEKRAKLAAWREQKRLRHEEWRRNSVVRDDIQDATMNAAFEAEIEARERAMGL